MSTLKTYSTIFFHDQVNGYVYAPQNPSGTFFQGPLGGRSGVIQLSQDYLIELSVIAGGSGYTNPTVIIGQPWAASTLQATNDQVVSGGNLYTVVSGGTSGTTAPTDTTGNVIADGTSSIKYVGKAAYVTATLSSGSITITGLHIQSGGYGYNSTPPVVITDPTGTGAIVNATINAFPTGGLVPGIAYLDQYITVGQSNGQLWTSKLNDVTAWYALSFVTNYAEPNNLVAIGKQLNYVVTFGAWTTSFYYDGGVAVQQTSPLQIASSYTNEIGCAVGTSVAQMEQSIVWVGQSKDTGVAVYMLEGLSPVKISDAYVERILTNSVLNPVTAYTFKYNGHLFYVLTLGDLNITVVYDVGEKMWYNWSTYDIGTSTSGYPGIYAEQYFRPSYYAGSLGAKTTGLNTNGGPAYFFLDDDNGNIYQMSSQVYNDYTSPINTRIVTPLLDFGNTNNKFFRKLEIVGDKVSSVMNIRHTDDDYNTWSKYRTVNLNSKRSVMFGLGQSRRRAFELFFNDNKPLRIQDIELELDAGDG